jgi:hypothetical protein
VKCSDGYLNAHELSGVGATAVVANCCDSERWARKAVDNGADVAVATTGPIPVVEAERDGADLAGLLSLGWCVEGSVNLLRRLHDGAGWVTVGDGGRKVTTSEFRVPPTVAIDTEANEVSIDWRSPDGAGGRIESILADTVQLPETYTYDLTAETHRQIEQNRKSPVVIDNERLDWLSYGST